MSRRIDVELTSNRGDGSWTWRAAGARQPRGVVDATLVPEGATVGEVLRADADFDLDGVTVVGLAPIQEKKRNEAERIEVIGPPRRDQELVTSSLVKGGRADRSDRRERRPREGGPGGRDRRDRERSDRERPDRRDRPDKGERPDRRERPERAERPRSAGRRPPRPASRRAAEAQAEAPASRVAPIDPHCSTSCRRSTARSPSRCSPATSPPCVKPSTRRTKRARRRGEPAIDGRELLALAEKLRPRLSHRRVRATAPRPRSPTSTRSTCATSDLSSSPPTTRRVTTNTRARCATPRVRSRRVDSEQASWLEEIASRPRLGRAVPRAAPQLAPAEGGHDSRSLTHGPTQRGSECVVDGRSAGGSLGRGARGGGVFARSPRGCATVPP